MKRPDLLPVVGLVLWLLQAGCTSASGGSASIMDRVTLAPTAVGIPEGRQLQDVLDARAPLPSVYCARTAKSGAVSLRVEFDSEVAGNLFLLGDEGTSVSPISVKPRQAIYSVRGHHDPAGSPACLSIKLTQGWTLAKVSWSFY